MAGTPRGKRGKPDFDSPTNVISHIELIGLFQKKGVIEMIVVEIAPGLYRMEATIAWRVGRWTLMGTRGPRQFRSLDNLAKHLKTMGLGRTVTRLELLS